MRICLICKKPIKGTRLTGDDKIRDETNVIIGKPGYIRGRLGYIHINCKVD